MEPIRSADYDGFTDGERRAHATLLRAELRLLAADHPKYRHLAPEERRSLVARLETEVLVLNGSGT